MCVRVVYWVVGHVCSKVVVCILSQMNGYGVALGQRSHMAMYTNGALANTPGPDTVIANQVSVGDCVSGHV